MRYCQECGAIVANEDTFCQFCGIALEAIAIVPEIIAPKAEEFAPLDPPPADLPDTGELSFPVIENSSVPVELKEAILFDDANDNLPPQPIGGEVAAEEIPATIENAPEFFSAGNSSPANLVDEPQAEIELKSVSTEIQHSNINESFPPPENEFQVVSNPVESISELKTESQSVIEQPSPEFAPSGFLNEPENPNKSNYQDIPTISNFSPADLAQKPEEHRISANAPANEIESDDEPQTVVRGFMPDKGVSIDEPIVQDSIKENDAPKLTADAAQSEDFFDLPTKIGQSIDGQSFAKADAGIVSPPMPEIIEPVRAEPKLESAFAENTQDSAAPRVTGTQNPKDTPGSKSPKLKPLDEGTILNNRYEIVRKIGGGGMGAVYLANDKNLGGAMRAVKEMIQAYVDESQQEKAVQDFRRESVLLTQLEHPSIPTIYDYFFDEVNGRFYLVMKYISGGDLAGKLRAAPDGRLDERSVTEWAIEMADVLDYLHNLEPPIVYRDLKPSNIMVGGNSNKAMLIDFGIARWVNKEEKGVTAVGTMGYAPPELFAGNAEPRSDIYSLGATMFHLLTGADPQNNPLLIFDFTKNPRPAQIYPQLSSEMEAILMRAVEYNLQMRFASAAEMRAALQSHLDKIKAGKLTFAAPAQFAPQSQTQPAPPKAQSLVFCGFCGERIVPTDAFCAFCGTKQPEAVRAMASAHVQQQSPAPSGGVTAKLVLESGALEEPAFALEKDTNLVGREDRRSNIFPEVDLSRFDSLNKVSRRHARIWRQGSTFMIEDLGSANGTTLVSEGNQAFKLLAHQPRALTHGDKLKVGETTLHFFVN